MTLQKMNDDLQKKQLWLARLFLLYVFGLAVIEAGVVARVAELGGQWQIFCAQLSIFFCGIFSTNSKVARQEVIQHFTTCLKFQKQVELNDV